MRLAELAFFFGFTVLSAGLLLVGFASFLIVGPSLSFYFKLGLPEHVSGALAVFAVCGPPATVLASKFLESIKFDRKATRRSSAGKWNREGDFESFFE